MPNVGCAWMSQVQQRAIEITTTTVVHIFWRYKLVPHSLAILVPAQTVYDY